MNRINTNWLRWLLITFLVVTAENSLATPYIKTDSSSAVVSLLIEAKNSYLNNQFEQAAALLERALRINPRHPIIWHNLAGVRLALEDWKRAANLATKSLTLSASNNKYYKLRVRNWMVITLACEGMGDINCARKARSHAQALVQAQLAN